MICYSISLMNPFPVLAHSSLLAENVALRARVAALEAQLREREAPVDVPLTVRSALDAMPIFVSYVDSDLRYRLVNRTYERWFQRPREEIEGRLVSEVQPPSSFECMRPSLERVLRGEAVHYISRIADDHGRVIAAYDTRYLPHRRADGSVAGFFVLAAEATDHWRATHDLVLTRFSLEQAAESMFTVAPDGRILTANRAVCERLGYTREEMLALHIWDFVPKCSPTLWPEMWRTLREERRHFAETVHRTKSGELIAVDVSATFVEFDGFQYSCAFVRDIRARKLAEERLRQSERLASVGTLAAGIAHEINNPLGVILLLAEEALMDRPVGDALAEALREIAIHVRRCAAIVSSVQRFARRQPLVKTTLPLQGVLQRAVELTRAQATQQETVVSLAPPQGETLVPGSATELEQVAINLINNATRASTAGQGVLLAAGGDARGVWFTVSDSGCGMNSEEQRRAFDPFYSTHRSSGGTGLGLSIAHGIVHDHGGTIELQSAPGRGTVVTVRLPSGGGG